MAYSNPTAGSFLTRAGNYNVGKQLLDEVITLKRYIDASTDNLGSGEYYKIFSVPDNFALLDAYVVCDVVEGAADSVDVVDDDSATTTFVNDATLNTAGYTTATNARKTYQAAGFICLLANADITVAKFWVIIKGVLLKTTD